MSLPIDRTNLTAAQTNQVPSQIIQSAKNIAALQTPYDTIDELYNYTSGLVAGGVLQPYPHGLNRQALINGNFDVWQRGTSFSTPLDVKYTADRWILRNDGTGEVATASQQSFVVGQGIVPNEPKFFFRKQVTTPATGQTFNLIGQRIESVRTLAGGKVTLSFWAKADAPRTITTNFTQVFGSGGATASPVTTASQTHNLTTAWQRFTATFDIPSISGKAIGTNGDDYSELRFNFPLNSLLTIDIAQVQVNAGAQALPFQPRSFADELQLCQRYYEKSYEYTASPGIVYDAQMGWGIAQAIDRIPTSVSYKAQKRNVNPTITIYAYDGTPNKVSNYGANGNVATTNNVLVFKSTNGGFNGLSVVSGATNFVAGNHYWFSWVADAEL